MMTDLNIFLQKFGFFEMYEKLSAEEKLKIDAIRNKLQESLSVFGQVENIKEEKK